MRPAATVHALPADTDDTPPNGWQTHQSMVERAAVRARMHVPLQAGCSACVPGTLPASLHACVCTDDSGRSVLSACAKSPERHARREVRFVQREIGSGTGIGPVPYRQVMTIRAGSTSVRRHLGAAPVDWRSGRTLRWTCEGPCRGQDGAEARSDWLATHSNGCCVLPASRCSLPATSSAPHVPYQALMRPPTVGRCVIRVSCEGMHCGRRTHRRGLSCSGVSV